MKNSSSEKSFSQRQLRVGELVNKIWANFSFEMKLKYPQ